jgi:hypothetical protein
MLVMFMFMVLMALGAFSIIALADETLRPWWRHAGSFGLGASAGGVIGMIILGVFGERLISMARNFYDSIGVMRILAGLGSDVASGVVLSILVGAFLTGGSISWWFFNRSRFRK